MKEDTNYISSLLASLLGKLRLKYSDTGFGAADSYLLALCRTQVKNVDL